MAWYPKSYITVNGVSYRLDTWHYANDYATAICTYIVNDLDAIQDQIVQVQQVTDN